MSNKLLSLAEMAADLGKSYKTFRRDVREKQIPFYAIGKRMSFDPHEVRAYIRTTEEVPESNVRLFPVTKKGKSKITSKRFAEAV